MSSSCTAGVEKETKKINTLNALASGDYETRSAQLPLVSLQFGSKLYLSAMLDSGAQVSCVTKDTVRSMLSESNRDIKMRGTARQLNHAGEAALQVLGEAVIRFELSGKEFTWTFLVVAGLSHKIILGEDFIETHVQARHVQSKTVEFTDGTFIPFFKKNMEVRSSHVHVLGTHVIPPFTSKLVPIITRKHIPRGNVSAMFVPHPTRMRTRALNYEIVNINNRVANVLFDNFTDTEVRVNPIQMGTIIEIRDLEVMTLSEYQAKRDAGELMTGMTPDRSIFPMTGSQRRENRRDPDLSTKCASGPDHPASVSHMHEQKPHGGRRGTEEKSKKDPDSKSTPPTSPAFSSLPPGFLLEENLTEDQKKTAT